MSTPQPNSNSNSKPQPHNRRAYVLARAREVAIYVAQTGCTLRQAAEVFKYSKSTIHLDLTERAPHCTPFWYKEARKVLDKHKAERGKTTIRNRRRKLTDEFKVRNSNSN